MFGLDAIIGMVLSLFGEGLLSGLVAALQEVLSGVIPVG